ncbi:MAG: hypothetical protein CUN56_01380 [Phototrophicales bacterium]|nr:MAG: hypothetical protein CUN56_01380 [Phototrophicales bacterium]RMG74714.1 MAG: carbonic anhydrase [Chloroflexota bacterium]
MHHQKALKQLIEGNRRFAAMKQKHPHQTHAHRQELVEGQHPFAAILSCSDSRVPSEIVFDQGLGDLFIVRTAGHTIDDLVIASLEYAVFVLKVSLIMVVGHEQCGAVTAVLTGQELPGHLPALAHHLNPALESIDTQADHAIETAIKINSCYTARTLINHSEVLRQATEADQLRIVPAYYDLKTGVIELLA